VNPLNNPAPEPRLTEHGRKRGKERAGLAPGALRRAAGKALAEGLKPRDTTGSLRRYLDRISIEHPGKHPRVHADHIFIFADSDLITVLHLPHEYRNSAASARKKKGGES
jgi:hypothetical protein